MDIYKIEDEVMELDAKSKDLAERAKEAGGVDTALRDEIRDAVKQSENVFRPAVLSLKDASIQSLENAKATLQPEEEALGETERRSKADVLACNRVLSKLNTITNRLDGITGRA